MWKHLGNFRTKALLLKLGILVCLFATPAWSQVGTAGRHVAELARYLADAEIYAPIVYRNLAVFPIRLHDGQRLDGRWLTMDQAVSRGVLLVTETDGGGRVPAVRVSNRSRSEHVLIVAGEILAGGKQTRTVREDAVLAPGQSITLDVFCVEKHRWEGESKFRAGNVLVPQSIRRELRLGSDQNRVWTEIDRNNRALGAMNETGSLELALKSPRVQPQLLEIRRHIVPEVPRDTIGFVFVDGATAVGAELFGRTELAQDLLPKLLDSYSVDLIVKRPSREAADNRNQIAINFFERIRGAASEYEKTAGSGQGIRLREGDLLGHGVAARGELVHFGVQLRERVIIYPR